MAVQSATSNFGWQNKFSTTLSSGITASDTTIPLTSLPTPSEGFLVIEPDSSTNWEVIYYTSKTGSAVVCTSVASGRGQDDSTAQSHSSGATVRMDTTAGMFEVLQNMSAMTPGSAGGTAFASGWTLIPSTVFNTVVANGNRSYTCTVNSTDLTSYISAGMRVRTTRTVAAPTQCTSLNGTTQYYSKSSPAGMTFTDDFTVSAWVKLSSYTAGAILARHNGSTGYWLGVNSSGQLTARSQNGAGDKNTTTYQSLPLNKWVHVAISQDVSGASYAAYIDGVLVPSTTSGSGTGVTQAGDLQIGYNVTFAATYFAGKIAQAAVYSAVLSAATILAQQSYGLVGTETSLISAYSFNNAITDLNTTNANNLTANGSAVATNADSPFGAQADGTVSSTLDYGIITKISYSTNTTVVVQVPEGCTIPTTGGVSALSYSIQKAPYGMPVQTEKWRVTTFYGTQFTTAIGATSAFFASTMKVTVPIGEWNIGYQLNAGLSSTVSGVREGEFTMSATTPTYGSYPNALVTHHFQPTGTFFEFRVNAQIGASLAAAATYTVYGGILSATGTESFILINGSEIYAICAYL